MDIDHQKKIMIENGIPYNDIDPEMRELIYLLNFNLGIKTKFCCIGERKQFPSMIMFHESTQDDQIRNLYAILEPLNLNKKRYIKGRFSFNKWLRQTSPKNPNPLGQLHWVWEFNKGKSLSEKIRFVNKLCEHIKAAPNDKRHTTYQSGVSDLSKADSFEIVREDD